MFARKKLSVSVRQALGIGVAALACSGSAWGVEAILVTGSNIKTINAETAMPVDILDRTTISRTGATTVNELLKYMSTVDIYDQGEIASNSPAGSGTANVRLRGLAENNTLVLLNGRRLPINGLYDSSGAGAAVDINMIPISAIERIEVLKDGGSAIYGADAVAGVFNIITRKDYKGLEASAGWGTTSRSDGDETRASVFGGFGDRAKDGWNVTAAFDYFKRDPILRKDREISKSVDFRRFGGPDARSSFAPQGNVVDPETFAFTGETIQPCPPELYTNRCRYDFNASLLTGYNGAERYTGMVMAGMDFSRNMRGFFDFLASESKDHFDAHPVPDYFVSADGRIYGGRFMQGGPRMTDRKSTLYHATLGLEGTVAETWDWTVYGARGQSKVTNDDRNYYDANLWYPALESGAIDATVDTNDPALVESLKVTPKRVGKSTITSFDARMSNSEIFKLPAGPGGVAFGASWWREELTDTPDELSQQGNVVGSIAQAPADGKRNAWAIYAETVLPLHKTLETQLAVRYDHYPQESKTSPKAGFRYQPARWFVLRGSYTESFRAPSLKQLYGALEEGAVNITNEAWCAEQGIPADSCDIPSFEVSGSNPDLKSERGKTYNIGFVFEPVPAFNATVDYFRITKKDDIDRLTIDQALEKGFWGRDPDTGRYLVFTNLANVAKTEIRGLDSDLRLRIPASVLGLEFTFRNANTLYFKQAKMDVEGAPWDDYNGTYAVPRWKNVFSVTTKWQAWNVGMAIRSVSGFIDTDTPSEAPGTRHVGAYDETDITVQYEGIKNLNITVGGKNIFDRQPPFSLQNVITNQYEQIGFAPLYTNRGAFYYFNVRYKFI